MSMNCGGGMAAGTPLARVAELAALVALCVLATPVGLLLAGAVAMLGLSWAIERLR